jgi:hypothetical protein
MKMAVTIPQTIRRYSMGPDNTDSTLSIETSAWNQYAAAPIYSGRANLILREV